MIPQEPRLLTCFALDLLHFHGEVEEVRVASFSLFTLFVR